MRLSHLLGSTLLLSLAVAPFGVSRAVAAPPAESTTVSAAALVVPAAKAGRARPLIAVVADSEGAQTTDFIVPYGVFKGSGVADVRSVSTGEGPIKMTRGLRIMADETRFEIPRGVAPRFMQAVRKTAADDGDVLIEPADGAPAAGPRAAAGGHHAKRANGPRPQRTTHQARRQ